MVKLLRTAYMPEKVSSNGFTHNGIHYLVSPQHIFSLEERISAPAKVKTVATAPKGDNFETNEGNLAYRFGQIWVRLESGAIMNPFDKKEATVELPPGRTVYIDGHTFAEESAGTLRSVGATLIYDASKLSEPFNIGNGVIVAKGIFENDTLFYLNGEVFHKFPGEIKKMIPFNGENGFTYLVTSERSRNQIFRLDGSVYWEPEGGVTGAYYFNDRTYVHLKNYNSGGVDGLFDLKTKKQVFDLSNFQSWHIDLFLAGDSLCALNYREGEYTVSSDLVINQDGKFRRETLKRPVAVVDNCETLLLGANNRTVYRLSVE